MSKRFNDKEYFVVATCEQLQSRGVVRCITVPLLAMSPSGMYTVAFGKPTYFSRIPPAILKQLRPLCESTRMQHNVTFFLSFSATVTVVPDEQKQPQFVDPQYTVLMFSGGVEVEITEDPIVMVPITDIKLSSIAAVALDVSKTQKPIVTTTTVRVRQVRFYKDGADVSITPPRPLATEEPTINEQGKRLLENVEEPTPRRLPSSNQANAANADANVDCYIDVSETTALEEEHGVRVKNVNQEDFFDIRAGNYLILCNVGIYPTPTKRKTFCITCFNHTGIRVLLTAVDLPKAVVSIPNLPSLAMAPFTQGSFGLKSAVTFTKDGRFFIKSDGTEFETTAKIPVLGENITVTGLSFINGKLNVAKAMFTRAT